MRECRKISRLGGVNNRTNTFLCVIELHTPVYSSDVAFLRRFDCDVRIAEHLRLVSIHAPVRERQNHTESDATSRDVSIHAPVRERR